MVFDVPGFEQRCDQDLTLEHLHRGAVSRRDVVEIAGRHRAGRARHVLHHERRIARDKAAEVARDEPRIGVVAAADRGADQHRDALAFVELFHGLRRGGQGHEPRTSPGKRKTQSATHWLLRRWALDKSHECEQLTCHSRTMTRARECRNPEGHMLARRAFLSGGAATIGLCATGQAFAQSYPTRPIKRVWPFPPGGPTDGAARLIGERRSAALGQPIVIENRAGGAGGTIGAKAVATADPDGYTLLISAPGPLVTAPAIYKNAGYDPAKDFAPVASLFSSPQILVVNSAVPAKTMRELVDHAKANPGKISYAS